MSLLIVYRVSTKQREEHLRVFIENVGFVAAPTSNTDFEERVGRYYEQGEEFTVRNMNFGKLSLELQLCPLHIRIITASCRRQRALREVPISRRKQRFTSLLNDRFQQRAYTLRWHVKHPNKREFLYGALRESRRRRRRSRAAARSARGRTLRPISDDRDGSGFTERAPGPGPGRKPSRATRSCSS
ncbi:hypothetical protein EVAR_12001_1 [Eumeta japonica]|uniref:Uncharacterized protein n=1 Tax=Eumeta variegata TaxID=151549 RepID=A0A4C1U570_EUMVA|nr:hypothetical protein EVAR_12001_1 [Eumeta japonica]